MNARARTMHAVISKRKKEGFGRSVPWSIRRSLMRPSAMLAALVLTASMNVVAEPRAVLVGVSDYPNLPAGYEKTVGARNDVELLRETLRQRGFAPENVRVLADGVPGAEPPTRANILRALDDIAELSRPGDVVYLHMSGHGSLEPGSQPNAGPTPIFLPIDIGRWDGGVGGVDNAIRQQDLRERVDRITGRGAFVWGVFDTCHSATLVRGAASATVVPRFVRPADLGLPHDVVSSGRRAQRQAAAGLLEARKHAPDGRGGTAFFYAAQTGESAIELPLPRGASASRRHGLFSFHVAKALESRAPMSYRQLGQSILAAYGSLAQAYATPVFSGDSLDLLLLGQQSAPVRQWPLRLEGGMRVDAGLLSGVAPGAVLSIVGTPLASDGDVIGYLRVVTADIGHATLEPVAFAGKVIIPAADLRPGQYLRLAYSPPQYGLRVAVDLMGCTGRCILDAAVERLRNTEVKGVDVQWVDAVELADVVVRYGPNRVDLQPPIQIQRPAGNGAHPPGFVIRPNENSETLSSRLADALHSLARARNMLALAAQFAGEAPSTGLKSRLQVEGRSGRPDVVVPRESVAQLTPRDVLSVDLENEGAVAVDVTILHLDASHGITVLFPSEKGESNRLTPGTTRRVSGPVLLGAPGGLERLLVIARNAMPGSERSDFSFLSQRSVARTRSATRPEVTAFKDAAFADYKRRGMRYPSQARGGIDIRLHTFSIRSGRS